MQSIQSLPVPVIARVHGIATAAGCQLVASCDLAIAEDSARFAVSGINVGLFCATPAVALSRNVSPKRAFDMLITGRFIGAATATDWGLINEAVAADELDAAIERKTAEILAKSPAAVRYGKTMFYRQRQMALADAYTYAGDVMARNMMEEDACEGIDAFLAKRAGLEADNRNRLNGRRLTAPCSRTIDPWKETRAYAWLQRHCPPTNRRRRPAAWSARRPGRARTLLPSACHP